MLGNFWGMQKSYRTEKKKKEGKSNYPTVLSKFNFVICSEIQLRKEKVI